jgi:hypothetical protein
MTSATPPFGSLLQVRATMELPPQLPAAASEPLSYALWVLTTPALVEPDVRPRTLLRAYTPAEAVVSRYLNATV